MLETLGGLWALALSHTARWVSGNSETLLAIAVGILVLLFLWGIHWNMKRSRRLMRLQRGNRMTRKERQQYLRDRFGARITDMIEEMEWNGEISPTEADKAYRQLSHILTISALLPRKVKREFKTREHLQAIRDTIFGQKLVYIPGPKPGEDMEFIKIRLVNWTSNIKNWIPFRSKSSTNVLGAGLLSKKDQA